MLILLKMIVRLLIPLYKKNKKYLHRKKLNSKKITNNKVGRLAQNLLKVLVHKINNLNKIQEKLVLPFFCLI